jgi:hypothetical protein
MATTDNILCLGFVCIFLFSFFGPGIASANWYAPLS